MADTLLIDGIDIQAYAKVTDASGLIDTAPAGGDLIVMDWTAGGVWQAGAPQPYTFDVQLLMAHEDDAGALADLQWLQQWIGREVTLTRRITVGAAQVDQSCRAVVINIIPSWSFESRNLMDATLRVQNLSGGWA
jgi:hypothetical protein